MGWHIRDLTVADTNVVAIWRYEPPYDVYDLSADPAQRAEMMDAASLAGAWFAVDDDEGALAGFLEMSETDGEVEIGLGMRPDLTGRGLGVSFIGAAMAFARDRWHPATFGLDVFPWNARAIRAYERAGFTRGVPYVRRFDDGNERRFLRMARPADDPGSRRFTTALVLVAHPDDAEFMVGGTVARWAEAGTEVHYVVITDGSAGSNEPGATREATASVREREQREAARVLGVRSVTFLGEADGTLEVTPSTRRKVCREVRRLRPEVIVAPDPARLWSGSGYVNHWDHKQAGLLALTVVMPDAPSRPMFPELLDEGLEPFEVPNLWLASEEPDTFVDIGATIERKIEALHAHESQGMDEVAPWVRERAEEVGRRSGLGYAHAEAFKAIRLVDDDPDEDA